jgi:hypothetical protein
LAKRLSTSQRRKNRASMNAARLVEPIQWPALTQDTDEPEPVAVLEPIEEAPELVVTLMTPTPNAPKPQKEAKPKAVHPNRPPALLLFSWVFSPILGIAVVSLAIMIGENDTLVQVASVPALFSLVLTVFTLFRWMSYQDTSPGNRTTV